MSESETRGRLCLLVTSSTTATTFLHGYLGFLQHSGWHVTLVCAPGEGLHELAANEGVQLMTVDIAREPSPLKDLRAVLAVRRILRRLRPDVLVYATPKASLVGSIAGWAERIPRRNYELWGLRLETSQGLSRRVFMAMEWLTARLSTQVIANSASLARRAEQLGVNAGRPVVVLGAGSSHGVDVRHFSADAIDTQPSPRIAEGLSDADSMVVGFVGRFHPDKGLDTLAAAVRMLSQGGRRVHVLLVGGDEGVAVDELFDGATASFRTTGLVTDVRPCLRTMDVLVLPSRREGFPNVVLEAAAMGVPAIVSDATGCRDAVIDGTTGLVVPVGDVASLAEAIASLDDDPEQRRALGAAARRRAVRDFDPETVWSLHERAWTG